MPDAVGETGQSAEVVIIGGGVIGCSIAYHLTRMGWTDVLVLEQFQLTHGATWHAAGLVGQLRPSQNVTRMLQRSIELYDELEADTGQAIDWKKVGSLRIASSNDRMMEFRRAVTTAKSFGLHMQMLTTDETKELFPIMSTDGVVGSAYLDSDGYVDPASLCQALATGARKRGARFVQNCQVNGFQYDDRKVSAVETDQGVIQAGIVVNASGMWGHELGKMLGCRTPAFAVEHQYLVTDPIPDLPVGMPTVRDPDLRLYYKPEVRGIVVGGYEDNTVAFARGGIPAKWDQQLIQENYDRFEPLARNAGIRTPIVNEVGVRTMINGAIPISADGDFVMGKAPEFDNVFTACGFIYGIAAAGGAGAVMAEWIMEGRPKRDLWPLDVRRFHFHHDTRWFMYDRAIEIYAKHYDMKWPVSEQESVRNVRHSPLYHLLKERGAVFGSKSGWERPNWFAPEGVAPKDEPSFTWPNWFEHVGVEHKAVREKVAMIDQSSFAKMEIVGPGALAALQRLTISNVDRAVGSVIYTQMLNESGGIESDLTFCRTAEDCFYVVTGTAYGDHDFARIRQHLPDDGSVQTTDVTSAYAVINLCGPHARGVLAKVAEESIDTHSLPFAKSARLTVGAAPALAMRTSFTGELSFELHIPAEYAIHVYQILRDAGEEFGITDVGYRAINSLRMEKGLVAWAADVTPDYTPYHAGMERLISWKKGDFVGREALEKIRDTGPDQYLCTFELQEKAPVNGGEAILLDGKVLGVTCSADFGHTVGKPIVMGYVPAFDSHHTNYQVEVYGEPIAAIRRDGAIYDPSGIRFRA